MPKNRINRLTNVQTMIKI